MPRHIHTTPFIIKPPVNLVEKQPGLRRLSHALGLKYASKNVVTEEDIQIMGSALWEVLALDDEFASAHKGLAQQFSRSLSKAGFRMCRPCLGKRCIIRTMDFLENIQVLRFHGVEKRLNHNHLLLKKALCACFCSPRCRMIWILKPAALM